MWNKLVLEALVPLALVLILHDPADEPLILFQEPLDCLSVDIHPDTDPVWYEAADMLGRGQNPISEPSSIVYLLCVFTVGLVSI